LFFSFCCLSYYFIWAALDIENAFYPGPFNLEMSSLNFGGKYISLYINFSQNDCYQPLASSPVGCIAFSWRPRTIHAVRSTDLYCCVLRRTARTQPTSKKVARQPLPTTHRTSGITSSPEMGVNTTWSEASLYGITSR
jgi:hypothetical protein